eukprot:scaffold22060_cov68-Phaeocystis_antarctica.AAC.11
MVYTSLTGRRCCLVRIPSLLCGYCLRLLVALLLDALKEWRRQSAALGRPLLEHVEVRREGGEPLLLHLGRAEDMLLLRRDRLVEDQPLRRRLEEHAVRVEHERGLAPHRAVVPAAHVLGRIRKQAAQEGAPDGICAREPAEIGPRSGRVGGDAEAAHVPLELRAHPRHALQRALVELVLVAPRRALGAAPRPPAVRAAG